MVFIVVGCLKLGLDVLVQKLENIKDFRTLRIHIWLFLSTGSLSTESTNSNSEVFEKNFRKFQKRKTWICLAPGKYWGFPSSSVVKNPPAMQEMRVWPLVQEDPMEEDVATYSNTFARKILSTEKPGGLQSMGSWRVGRNWVTELVCTQTGYRLQCENLPESLNDSTLLKVFEGAPISCSLREGETHCTP